MLMAGFDLETTGFNGAKDHIVQYSFQIWNDSDCIVNNTSYVNPGVPITNSEIHGVTDAMVKDASGELDAIVSVESLFQQCFLQNIPIVIMNAKFDITFWHNLKIHQYARIPFGQYKIIDPLVIDRQFDKYRPGKRNLERLARHYQVPISDEFHSADYDVKVSIQVAIAQLIHWNLLPVVSWSDLHNRQRKWSDAQMRSLYEYFISIGNEDYKNISIGWPVETSLLICE